MKPNLKGKEDKDFTNEMIKENEFLNTPIFNSHTERKSFDMLKQNLNESKITQFITKFKRYYTSGKLLSFKDWLKVMEELIDELD